MAPSQERPPPAPEQTHTEPDPALTDEPEDSPAEVTGIVTPEEIAGLGGALTTASALVEEEIPPEPPLYAAPGGPSPPPGLRFDFAYERTVIPADPAQRSVEQVNLNDCVPLPLDADAVTMWADLIEAWFSYDGPHRRYEYLLRKGHLGALMHLYPSARPEPIHQHLLHLGFSEEVAHREAVRRQKFVFDTRQNPAVQAATETLQQREDEHNQVKESFSKAFVDAQKRKGKR